MIRPFVAFAAFVLLAGFGRLGIAQTSTVVRQEEIPLRYRDVGGLSFEVPTDRTAAANFDLTTKP